MNKTGAGRERRRWLAASGKAWERPQRIRSAWDWPWELLCRPRTSGMSRQFLRGNLTRATATVMPGQHTVTRWERPVGLGCRERGARGRPARGRRAEGRKGFFPLRIRRLRQSWYCGDSGVQTEGYTFSRKARITPFNTFSVSTTVGSSRDVFFNGRLQAED